MNRLIPVIHNFLRFYLSFKSVIAIITSGLALVLFFAWGTSISDGYGYSSTLFILGGGVPIPFMVVNTIYNSVFMIATLAVIMATFQLCEFVLFGHFSHSVIGSIQHRPLVITAFLVSLLLISLPLSLIFLAHYVAIAHSTSAFMFVLLSCWLYTYSLILMSILILNVNRVRKMALFTMILTFVVAPTTSMILSTGLKSMGGAYGLLSWVTFEIYNFLGLHFQLSRLIDFTISSSFINWSELFGLLVYLLPYLTLIITIYLKKELS
jgi:hypothetical protein